jgi:hypothetical protein
MDSAAFQLNNSETEKCLLSNAYANFDTYLGFKRAEGPFWRPGKRYYPRPERTARRSGPKGRAR